MAEYFRCGHCGKGGVTGRSEFITFNGWGYRLNCRYCHETDWVRGKTLEDAANRWSEHQQALNIAAVREQP